MAEHLHEAEEGTLDEEDKAFIAKVVADALNESAKRQAEERGRHAASMLCLAFLIGALIFALFMQAALSDVRSQFQDLHFQISRNNQSVSMIGGQAERAMAKAQQWKSEKATGSPVLVERRDALPNVVEDLPPVRVRPAR